MHFFDQIKEYIGFDKSTAETLTKLKPAVSPYFDDIVDDFYDALWSNEQTRNVFEGPEQVERLRNSLHRWLSETFTGPYDEEYFENRKHIGQVHHEMGLEPHFLFGAMNIIRTDLVEMLNREDIEPDQDKAIKSTEKSSISI
jgi:truncated hemoglobin YjbI